MERRVVAFEFKASKDDAPFGSFEGYGSVFGTVDSYDDTIAKGAFADTLREWNAKGKLPKMLLQHGGGFFGGTADDMVPIGKYDEMREDDHGLYVKGHLFDLQTDRTHATYAAMKAGEMDGLSIGFKTRKYEMDQETGIRTLTDIQLYEVSVVTFPANDPARLTGVKQGVLPTAREFERWLQREAGFSKSQAEIIISKGYRRVLQGGALPSDEACGELLAAVKRRAAIFTGDGNVEGAHTR